MSRPRVAGSSKRRIDANMASPEKSCGSYGNGFMEMEAGVLIKMIEVGIVQFLLCVRNELREQTHLYHEFIELMLEVRRQSTNVGSGGENFSMESCRKRVRRLFDGRTHLIRGFEDLSEGKPFRHESISDPIRFLQKMKSCTKISKKDYDRFLEIIFLFYNKSTMTVDDVLQQVLPFMSDSPELLEEFRSFLPPRLAQAPLRHEHTECRIFEEVKKADDNLKYAIEDIKNENNDSNENFLHASTFIDDILPPEMDLSNCSRPTPSYCKLPENHAALQSSSRTEIEKSVLNDALVSITSWSEDCFKFRSKNRYEENILRCEDDMFEREMLLERLIMLAKRIKKLHDDLIDNKLTFDLEKDLTSIDRRCIEQLYEDQGLEMLAALSENPCAALPIILDRANQKAEELKEEKQSLDKASADTIANNYYRSLDHRSSLFKQLDIKRMSSKALLAEARETRKMKTKSGNKSSSAVSNQLPSVPNIEFDCMDVGIYEDIYNIINYASSRICTSDVMIMWRKLIEPLLGVECELPNLSGKASGKEASASEHKDSNKGFCSASDDAIEADGIFSVTKGNMETPKSGTDKLTLHDEFLLSSKRDKIRRTDLSISCAYRTENSPKRLKCNEGYSSQHYFEQEMEEGEFIPHIENAQHNILISSERGGYAADSEFGDDHIINNSFQPEVEKDKFIVSGLKFSSGIVPDPAGPKSTQAGHEVLRVEEGVSIRSSGPVMMPRTHVPPKMFYGSNFYVLLRLHQVLYKRLLFTKNKLCQPRPEVEMIPNDKSTLYTKFKEKFCELLNGSIDNSVFEDYCLLTIGPESYELFTLDKLISRIIDQLCTIASNDKGNERGSDIPEGRIFRFTCSVAPTRRSIEPLESEQNEVEKSTESTQQVAQNHLQRRTKRKQRNEQELPLQSNEESS